MAAIVPVVHPGVASQAEVRSGQAVLGTTHTGVARLTNWAMGRGMCNIPVYSPGNTIAAAANGSYFFRVAPRYQAIQRVWCFTLRSTSTSVNSTVAIKVPSSAGSTTATVIAGGDRDALGSFVVPEARASQSATEEIISCNLAVTGNACVVESISCWDMPRAELALDVNDDGVDLLTTSYRQPIYDGTCASIGGEADAVVAALATCRRVLMQWALPATTTEARSTSSTSYVSALGGGTSIVLARKLYRSSTTGTLSAKIYARTADTSDIGDVRFTTTSGSSQVINIPTGSHANFAWFGAPLTFTADCEDLTVSDGRRSTRWDLLTVEFKVSDASDILYLASISVWEA